MKTNIKLFNFYIAVAALLFTACSDQFLQDKKNYDNATTEIYNYLSGCNGRVNDIYGWCLPAVGDLTTGQNYLSGLSVLPILQASLLRSTLASAILSILRLS